MPPPLVPIADDNPDNLSVVGGVRLPRHAVCVATLPARVAAWRGRRFDPAVTDAALNVCDDRPATGLRHG